VQLIKFTLRRGPTVQTEMSLTTAGIHCTISQRLSARCDGRLFHSPGPAAENALSPSILYIDIIVNLRE